MKALLRLLMIGGTAAALLPAQTASGITVASQKKIAVLDDCDPKDPAWDPTGGCTLKPNAGDVTFSEFLQLLVSPLSAAVIGHPSWRNDPSYVTVNTSAAVRVTNEGGRGHTFTRVADYGGGFIPLLNQGLVPAPECLGPPSPNLGLLEPGQTLELKDLPPGLHKFQCCIHPWMRTAVRITPKK